MFYSYPLLRNAKLLKDTNDAYRELFTEHKEEIETKADEAMAPKDENGEPIEQVGQTDSPPPERVQQDSAVADALVEDEAKKAKDKKAFKIKI